VSGSKHWMRSLPPRKSGLSSPENVEFVYAEYSAFWPEMFRNAVHNAFLNTLNSGNAAPMRSSSSFSTIGTAFPRVHPRNDPWLAVYCEGDIEGLMGLSAYIQTSTCTQTCEILVLRMKHFERLLVRRNPNTIDGLRRDLERRIRSRICSR